MKKIIILSYAFCVCKTKGLMLKNDFLLRLTFLPNCNKLRNFNAIIKVYYEFWKAKRTVPAYRSFLESQKFDTPSFNGFLPNIAEIPSIDKQNYVQKYSIETRCIHGKIPNKGVIIDESSGSTGNATNWVRGKKERNMNGRMIQFGLENLFGTAPKFVINAFAMGAWATGINVSINCLKFSKLKSLGPDKQKIINTLKDFGTNHSYVIMGYPPFLKILLDDNSIDWKTYKIDMIVGGESMSEGLRTYFLDKGIQKIYSSFGASDLELNIGAENDFTISLRKLIAENTNLRKALIAYNGAMPMIFQYNPIDFFIETNPEGELLFTINRPNYIAPKIRYNLKDKGYTVAYQDIMKIMKQENVDISKLILPKTDLPLMFHFGRNDLTVSFFGANICPMDIQETIFCLDILAQNTNSFFIEVKDDIDNNKTLIINIELKKNFEIDTILENTFFEKLAEINQDFREAKKMTTQTQLQIKTSKIGEGIFAENEYKIKSSYL